MNFGLPRSELFHVVWCHLNQNPNYAHKSEYDLYINICSFYTFYLSTFTVAYQFAFFPLTAVNYFSREYFGDRELYQTGTPHRYNKERSPNKNCTSYLEKKHWVLSLLFLALILTFSGSRELCSVTENFPSSSFLPSKPTFNGHNDLMWIKRYSLIRGGERIRERVYILFKVISPWIKKNCQNHSRGESFKTIIATIQKTDRKDCFTLTWKPAGGKQHGAFRQPKEAAGLPLGFPRDSFLLPLRTLSRVVSTAEGKNHNWVSIFPHFFG